jgi:hypothetical protein
MHIIHAIDVRNSARCCMSLAGLELTCGQMDMRSIRFMYYVYISYFTAALHDMHCNIRSCQH